MDKKFSLVEQVDCFGPALGLKIEEITILCELVERAPALPSPRRLESLHGFKRKYIKALLFKFERLGFVKYNNDSIDFSGLIRALDAIPSSEKKRLEEELYPETVGRV